MKKSKVIAISGIATAFSVLLLSIGAYFPTFDLSALFMASLVVMLPLSKKSYLGAVITTIASSILTLIIAGFRYQIVIPFALFFGMHPIVNYFQASTNKFNKWIFLIVKDVWFVLVLVLMQKLSEVLIIDIESIKRFVYPILIVGGAIGFIVYDFLMQRFQNYIDLIIKRLKL